jgi:hypothetical protein
MNNKRGFQIGEGTVFIISPEMEKAWRHAHRKWYNPLRWWTAFLRLFRRAS